MPRTRFLGKSLKTQAADHVYPSVECPQCRTLDSLSSATEKKLNFCIPFELCPPPPSREEDGIIAAETYLVSLRTITVSTHHLSHHTNKCFLTVSGTSYTSTNRQCHETAPRILDLTKTSQEKVVVAPHFEGHASIVSNMAVLTLKRFMRNPSHSLIFSTWPNFSTLSPGTSSYTYTGSNLIHTVSVRCNELQLTPGGAKLTRESAIMCPRKLLVKSSDSQKVTRRQTYQTSQTYP